MKRALALLLLGVLATMLQGAVATFAPPLLVPDLGLLMVFAIGFCWRSAAGGVLLAATLGYVADLLSGSLLGQHALLRVLAFGAARLGSRHLNLRGPLPQVVFVAALTSLHALLLATLTSFFAGGVGPGSMAPGDLVAHSLVNALCAPVVAGLTARVVSRLGDEDSARRLVTLEPPQSWSS